MKTFKLKIHSAVDLITNSSTTIFTYSEGSDTALKELVNEMLLVLGSNLKFDDLFYCEIFCERDKYLESEFFEQEDDRDPETYLEALFMDIMQDNIKKPEWMIKVEKHENEWHGYRAETFLELVPKDSKYLSLCNKIIKFLYSTYHEATRD